MKHVTRLFGLVALLFCCSFQSVVAQMQMPPIPVDKNVRIGHLENGLTYYIRHNAQPENRVDFYIAQKVGAIQEEPRQRGLAHFLEHMCFNGTKNFPGDETGLGIVQWCESKGIKFGTNLNAYTSVDETVYNISNVPTANQAVIDSCLLILHDWSNYVLLADKEIDKERGVIHEEWRQRNSGIMRLITDAQPVLYVDSKYSDCMPIGSIDVIDHFPYQDIRDYYAKWYRPDLQGIMIVGDVDVDAMEANIKKTFADIKAPVNPAKRVYYQVPDNDEPLIYVGKDKEIDSPSIMVFFKQDAAPDSIKGNMVYMLQKYLLDMADGMMNERFNELRQSANPPFISAGGGYGNYFLAKTKDAFQVTAQCKAEGIETALKSVLTELERIRRYGFTASEYARTRANYLQELESDYNEREKTESESYVEQYVRHFLDKEPIPGIEFEYTTMNQVAPNIPVEAINQVVKELITENNQAVFIGYPDKENITCPTKEAIKALLKGMKDLKVEPYVDKVSDEPLMKELPEGGSVVAEKQNVIYGATELTLSNGVKVYLKPTDFKADEIQMNAFSLGGTSTFENNEVLDYTFMNSAVVIGGIGNHSSIELNKLLAGKNASVRSYMSGNQEGVYGNCSPKDFETLMQLTYLQFTAPRKDEEAFVSFKNRLKAQLEGAKANPMSSFGDSVKKVIYNNHPRLLYMAPEKVDQLNYDRMIEMYKQRFADADDFKFFFVGNIDLEKVKPLIAQYLGALPAVKGSEKWVDRKMDMVKGVVTKEFTKQQETPTATILMAYNTPCAYNLRNNIVLSYLTQVLETLYTEEVREKEGGTYGVNCFGELQKFPKEECLLQIVYQTDPTKKDHLNKIIDAQLVKVAYEGPNKEHMEKTTEYMLKKHKDNLKNNVYWLGNLVEYFYTGSDNDKDYDTIVKNVTAKDVQDFAKMILNANNKATVIMTMPEEKAN